MDLKKLAHLVDVYARKVALAADPITDAIRTRVPPGSPLAPLTEKDLMLWTDQRGNIRFHVPKGSRVSGDPRAAIMKAVRDQAAAANIPMAGINVLPGTPPQEAATRPRGNVPMKISYQLPRSLITAVQMAAQKVNQDFNQIMTDPEDRQTIQPYYQKLKQLMMGKLPVQYVAERRGNKVHLTIKLMLPQLDQVTFQSIKSPNKNRLGQMASSLADLIRSKVTAQQIAQPIHDYLKSAGGTGLPVHVMVVDPTTGMTIFNEETLSGLGSRAPSAPGYAQDPWASGRQTTTPSATPQAGVAAPERRTYIPEDV